ncbi:MAG: hypothetical protein WA766_01870 [Candidatus Acidiferrales bacterium]
MTNPSKQTRIETIRIKLLDGYTVDRVDVQFLLDEYDLLNQMADNLAIAAEKTITAIAKLNDPKTWKGIGKSYSEELEADLEPHRD